MTTYATLSNRNPLYFSENITEGDLKQWEINYDAASKAYYEAKEKLTDEEKKI